MQSLIEVTNKDTGNKILFTPSNLVSIEEGEGICYVTVVNNYFRVKEEYKALSSSVLPHLSNGLIPLVNSVTGNRLWINPNHIISIEKYKRVAKLTVVNNYFFTKDYFDEVMIKINKFTELNKVKDYE